MTDEEHRSPGEGAAGNAGGAPLELALSRIVDREETHADWSVLHGALRRDDGLLHELLARLEEDHRLREAAAVAVVAVADRVGLPAAGAAAGARPATRSPWLRVAGGWLAAAALAIAWIVLDVPVGAGPSGGVVGGVDRAAHGPSSHAYTQALPRPIAGRDVAPREFLGTRPRADGGGLEAVFVRRVLEAVPVNGGRIEVLQQDVGGSVWADPVPAGALVHSSGRSESF